MFNDVKLFYLLQGNFLLFIQLEIDMTGKSILNFKLNLGY